MPSLDQLPAAYLAVAAEKVALEQEVMTLRAPRPGPKRAGGSRPDAAPTRGAGKLAARAEAPAPQKVGHERRPPKPQRDPAEAFAKAVERALALAFKRLPLPRKTLT